MEDQRLPPCYDNLTHNTMAKKMGTTKALASVAWALSLTVNVVMAADYVVGNPAGGWDGRTDYKSWSAAQTFAPGDTITFKYNSYHSVMEVTKDAFEACTTTDPISFDSSGSTTVALTTPGTRYFICGAPGHCLGGMKMVIEVTDRPAPTTPSSPPSPLPLPLPPPAHAKQKRPAAMAPTALSPAPLPWAPATAPVARRAGHKKQHRKRSYCPPETVRRAPARPPTVQADEPDFPVAAFAPMSDAPPPPTSGGPAAGLRAAWGEAVAALAAIGWFMLVVAL